MSAPSIGVQYVLDGPEALAPLIPSLKSRGFTVVGPTIRNNAIVCDPLQSLADLPTGWTARQEAGKYRLQRREDHALFGFTVGPQGWKRFLHPPEVRLFAAQREGGTFHILPEDGAVPRYAFFGVRSCDLAAIAIQDRVLQGEHHIDAIYQARRRTMFLIAVNCTSSQPTCFCASVHTAPPAEASFDLAITETLDEAGHRFLIEAGSRQGLERLAELPFRESTAGERLQAEAAVRAAVTDQKRSARMAGIRETLYERFEDPYWEEAAARCLGCANCTMVCPTCFCSTVEDTSTIDGARAERWRKWDSCFTESFSYIHGGSVRMSLRSRFRQRLTHKFAAWVDQFGSSGCVGCGRCITWCPAGIDVTLELATLAGKELAAADGRAKGG